MRPEQSNEEGPVAPQTYGLPRAVYAKATASAARALGAWADPRGALRSAWALPRPPSEAS